jgi:predicted DsbA family dithiol-disulfide isomerase
MEHYKRKFGPRAEQMLSDPNNFLNQRGKPIGVEFVYHKGSKVFNSFDCHRLLYYARTKFGTKKQNELQEAMFEGYFKNGINYGAQQDVVATAKKVGLPEDEVLKILSSDQFSEEVQEELLDSHSKVNGVPHFYFPSGEEASGGQEVNKTRSWPC